MSTAKQNLLSMDSAPPETIKRTGLAHWMQKVLEECDRAKNGLEADPVHDLRVALRRCRSLADGLMVIDARPGWKQMKKAGKALFGQLGALRDLHVMQEWIEQLQSKDDLVAKALLDHLAAREQNLKTEAMAALEGFDRERWTEWCQVLPKRAAHVPLNSLAFRHLALERWQAGYDLHKRALRNRTKVGFHQLRIGIKKFRYTVENFLPKISELWEDDLKSLQDLLGDVHDLDVLWATALEIQAFPDEESRVRWQERIEAERNKRLEKYRSKMSGRQSLWHSWRKQLPQGSAVETGAMERVRMWASFLDPDFRHAEDVTRLALQLFDGLTAHGLLKPVHPRARFILHAAALMHEVGRAKADKNHHKISSRWIRKMPPPLGLPPQDLQLAALVARYHRGALPGEKQKRFSRLAAKQKQLVIFLAGIMRVAESLDWEHEGKVHDLDVQKTGEFITVNADGHLQNGGIAEKIAAARHLLEVACNRPILVRMAS